MKLVNIGTKDSDSVINIDIPAIISSLKAVPTWLKWLSAIAIITALFYFVVFKPSSFNKDPKIQQLTESALVLTDKISETNSTLYNYVVILKYYNTKIKILSYSNECLESQQQMILDYLDGNMTKSDCLNLKRRIEDSKRQKKKLEEMYGDLLEIEDSAVFSLLNEINDELVKSIDNPEKQSDASRINIGNNEVQR